METVYIVLIIIAVLAVLAGIGVGIYFAVRSKDDGNNGNQNGDNNPPPPVPIVNPTPVPPTNPGQTVWDDQKGGSEGNTVPTSSALPTNPVNVDSLDMCKNVCEKLNAQNVQCDMVQYTNSNDCWLQYMTPQTGTNSSVLSQNGKVWISYPNAYVGGGDPGGNHRANLESEDACRKYCINNETSMGIGVAGYPYVQLMTTYKPGSAECMCKTNTTDPNTTQTSYIVRKTQPVSPGAPLTTTRSAYTRNGRIHSSALQYRHL